MFQTQMETNAGARSPLIVKFVMFLLAAQVVEVAVTFAAAPGYMLPFLHNPVCCSVWFGFVVWEFIGFALLYLFCPRRKGLAMVATFVALLSALPATVTPMLGPAVVTIINATGPVIDGK
jgi:hypothetical protein